MDRVWVQLWFELSGSGLSGLICVVSFEFERVCVSEVTLRVRFHSIGFLGYWVFKIYAISLKNVPDFDQIAYASDQENKINLFSYLSSPKKMLK